MKILLIIFFILLLSSFLPSKVFAVNCNDPAIKNDPKYKVECTFGTISPPPAISEFIGTDPTGAGGISKFLTNLVALIYGLAAIVLIFMFIWGAFDWMTSEGDKEKLESAKRKIINALIGIMLFAVAFAVIQILGQFTGFEFFRGQTRPAAPPTQQPDNCTPRYNTCINQAGNDINALENCWETYQACLKTNL